MAWIVLVAYGIIVVAAFLLLPADLIRERTHPGPGVVLSDFYLGGITAALLYPATLIVAGLDHAFEWSPSLSLLMQTLGIKQFIAGYSFAMWAMIANRFFSTFVRIQTDRGHRLVDTGPYAWVRHPGYTGTMIAHLGLPIALGSLWALIPAGLACVAFFPRMNREERVLRKELDGYDAYCGRVRYQLIPWVW